MIRPLAHTLVALALLGALAWAPRGDAPWTARALWAEGFAPEEQVPEKGAAPLPAAADPAAASPGPLAEPPRRDGEIVPPGPGEPVIQDLSHLYRPPSAPGPGAPMAPPSPLPEASPGPAPSAPPPEPAAPTLALFAPPPPPPPPPPPTPRAQPAPKKAGSSDLVVEELSYFMFKDEAGVIHMTDAPVDPRFREVKVQITISRGLAPFRRLSLEKIRPFILQAAARYKLDPGLIAAIVKAESAFDPRAVSWAGARGLMQLMPSTARLMGVEDSFDPESNIMGGSKYLRAMLDRFDENISLAVAAYNCGPERVARQMRIPDIPETRAYVKTVLANLEILGPLFSVDELPARPENLGPTIVASSPLDVPFNDAMLARPPGSY
ncbi:MAG: lytic transglycosylase domain-containing protein [Deltaproteobacteria bacterium]|nr:lytic transglycosylase domain-containing protein [Deltaproteobacteria bacterium]